ncbi:MAG: hypothetical protein A2942_04440 [Candidatus Lloydbacteria bacterium RIFCSPLOWO2_01_FULL_50_20]|uniref:Uncharacterized protein n=1 Tax=Candidatus Lloydbacteria bacterium RIFCSPLOWO2_01_FULL_50_20 TaxID=1798665 RepID=A0A1G2DCY0_9BACT|nr:MAG: hypothetical protein A3C13_03035 [Candidatus Lloydbacteria bacterium RIFCSPHIGHO2_02_FULL_50_11]OGZ11466.1 MAG: hypothetical protein A2942_04440 [Candidatus Lloydbacteria bacterium RIFCSPLOWO2_01_FULL_50_20]
MDNYFLWTPVLFIVCAVVLFISVGIASNWKESGRGIVVTAFLVGVFCLVFGLVAVYANGKGKPVVIEQAQAFKNQRLVVGETYTTVSVTEYAGVTYYILKGKDGVRFYSSKEAVPKKFIVQKDYGLREIEN